MPRVQSFARTTLLLAGLSIRGLSPARADVTVTLEGVTFADGATASGYFTLNADGYMETADAFSLILVAGFPVADGGIDPLIVGKGSGGSLAVSNECRLQGSGACGSVGR